MSDQIRIALPFDSRCQIERALSDGIAAGQAANSVGQAARLMRLLMSWQLPATPAVAEDQPEPRVGALALAPDWDDKTNNVVIERVDANGCQVTNSQGQSWWVGMDRIEVLADQPKPRAEHVHTEACEHRLVNSEVAGVSECYSCGPGVRDQYCPNACPVVLSEVLADSEQVTR